MMIVGSPDYLERHGTAKSVRDLEHHNRLGFSYSRAIEGWPLLDRGAQVSVPVNGNLRISDGESLRQIAANRVKLPEVAGTHAARR